MTSSEPAISGSAQDAASELRAVFSRLRRRLRESYGTDGLTPSQTAVLIRLAKEGPATTSELAAAERVRPQSMATTLAALDGLGLLIRTADPDDGRRVRIALSPAGQELYADRRRASEEWLARSLQDRCTEEERQTLLRAIALLDRLVEA
ncbi:MAG TPA: MarR family transcriptional regulator [Micromonosporaceae bacterium]|jgi:DNA-binding MarR family transcriptional regulator